MLIIKGVWVTINVLDHLSVLKALVELIFFKKNQTLK